jgi:hypothetical protein
MGTQILRSSRPRSSTTLEPGDDTPPRIAEMIKAGAFDWKAGE